MFICAYLLEYISFQKKKSALSFWLIEISSGNFGVCLSVSLRLVIIRLLFVLGIFAADLVFCMVGFMLLQRKLWHHLCKFDRGGKVNDASVLDEVFERFVKNAGIFKDREVLRHDYLPDKLPHREDQIRRLGETVAPVLKGERSSNLLIYGKTGTGKTAVTKHVLNHLEIKAKEFGAPFRLCFLNCRLAGTEYRVFASLCQSIGVNVPFTGLSVGEVFDRFIAGLDV